LPIDTNIPLLTLAALVGTFVAFAQMQRMRASVGLSRRVWMIAGGVTLALTIWSTHLIALMVVHSTTNGYSLSLRILSIFPVVVASLICFRLLRVPVLNLVQWLTCAVSMSFALILMHNIGMMSVNAQPSNLALGDTQSIPAAILTLFVACISLLWHVGSYLTMLFDQRLSRQHAEALFTLMNDHDAVSHRASLQSEKIMASMRDSEERLRMTLRCAPDMVFIADHLGRITFANDYAIESLGYSRHELMRKSIFDLVPVEWRETYRLKAKDIFADVERHTNEIRLETKDGKKIPLELISVRLPNGRVYGSCRDITQRKAAQREITQVNDRLNVLIEAIPDGIIFKDGAGRWQVTNETTKRLFRLHNIPWQSKTEKELAELQPELTTEYAASLAEDEQVWAAGKLQIFDRHLIDAEGVQHLEVRKVPIFAADGKRSGLVVAARDVTDQKRIQAEREVASEQIHQLAFYDTLTGLPNRRLLMDRLQQSFSVSARSGSHGALMFLDLDHFKNLNDSKGHDIGDELLLEISKRLESCVRDGDTVARLGGDEFVVVLENLGEHYNEAASHAETIGEKIRLAMSPPCVLKDHIYNTTMSVGIVLYKGNQHSLDDLLKHADIAMYQAKAAGRNAIRFYDPVMQAAQEERIKWEAELHLAVQKQQFVLYYQVQVNSLRQAVGAEVLIRWQHPERGLVSPSFFVPTAEETGMIVPIGSWVLQTACRQLRLWQNDKVTRNLTLAVNVSAKQFRQAGFVAEVRRVLQETGAKPSLLKLELTESTVLENVEDAISKMHELRALGVSFSVDDFGTGYSSLQYLKRLPLDQIKIDQTFVRDIASDPNDATIVKTIIVMAKALGFQVIAEGVEFEAQITFLEWCGCQSFQGYLFCKPMPIGQFEGYLRTVPRHSSALP
jgi:diguanylate cyclase (GGDEF)-like protein/PAS domain S-box-containing protein